MADQTPHPTSSIEDILRQLPKLNVSSPSFIRLSNERVRKSSSLRSGHTLPSSIWSFDDWVDYLSSKADSTSLPPATISPVELSDQDSFSDTHKPPTPSPSSLVLSYNEILDQYFSSVPGNEGGKNVRLNSKEGNPHASLFNRRCLIVYYSIASCTITNIWKWTSETKTQRWWFSRLWRHM